LPAFSKEQTKGKNPRIFTDVEAMCKCRYAAVRLTPLSPKGRRENLYSAIALYRTPPLWRVPVWRRAGADANPAGKGGSKTA